MARLRDGRSAIRRALTELVHAVLLHATVLAVRIEHRGVFLRGGYTLALFRRESESELSAVQLATYTCNAGERSGVPGSWSILPHSD